MEDNEMEQLLNMGFPNELAAQALLATGGKSTLKATEWLLSHQSHLPQSNITSNHTTTTSPPPLPPPQQPPPILLSQSQVQSQTQQPKLDKFFNFHPKPISPISQFHTHKKLKISPPSPPPQPPPAKGSDIGITKAISEPLAERMRPRRVEDIIGQEHILGPNTLLTSSIKLNKLPSIVLWGPPGTGKTSIAKALANSTAHSYKYVALSAVTSGVKDVREVVEEAKKAKAKTGKRTVLFVDEVHRFNKGQQDCFLPFIEDGSIVFIGATTENPSFHLVTPLLSRCRVLNLKGLEVRDVVSVLRRAVEDVENGLLKGFSGVKIEVEDEVLEFLGKQCDGDARVALNALEVSATTAVGRVGSSNGKQDLGETGCGIVVVINVDDAREALQCKHIAYDRNGEEHYNLISALIKSMRGSDADAAMYWLARMLEGGEQPLFIARRLVVFASEDVGLADPNALLQAVACHQACHIIGMPECRLNLAQCVAYLALAPKSVAAYQALKEAEKAVRESVGGNEGVPLHIRNAPTKLMKELGYGKGYIYTPDDPTAHQSFLPPSLIGRKFLHWPPRGT